MAEQPSPIRLDDLPPPPAEIADLIKAAGVTFTAGKRDDTDATSTGLKLAAKTRYQIEFNYRSRSRWKVGREGRQVVIHLHFSHITWVPKHRVWFRRRPATETFWKDKLVLHELDHVRISSAPHWQANFAKALRVQRVLFHSLAPGDAVNQGMIDRLIDQHAQQVFSGTSDLISIRYRELDRLTQHGLLPVPAESPIQAMLKPVRESPR